MEAIGRKGKSLERVVEEMLSDPELTLLPPKARFEAEVRRLRSELRKYVSAPKAYWPQIAYLEKKIAEVVKDNVETP